MKPDCKVACILIDKSDSEDFQNTYKDELAEKFFWFAIDYIPMIQLMLGEIKGDYYLPSVIKDNGCCSTLTSLGARTHKEQSSVGKVLLSWVICPPIVGLRSTKYT